MVKLIGYEGLSEEEAKKRLAYDGYKPHVALRNGKPYPPPRPGANWAYLTLDHRVVIKVEVQ